MDTVWRQTGIAVFLVLAVTAIIIAIAQVISAQEDGNDEQDEKHSCWDHWLCDQHTAVPTQPPPTTPPTGVPFCDRFPLHESCLSAPRPPTTVPPTAVPPTPIPPTPVPPTPIPPTPVPPTRTPKPPPTNTLAPSPVPTNTPRPGGGGTNPTNTLTPTSTNTPVPPPTATTIPLCGTAGHGNRGRSIGGGGEVVDPPPVVKIGGLKPLMERQGCVDANVSVSGLDRNKRYYISLTTERGLGFSNQCAQRNIGFPNLTGHRTYKFYFPLIACGSWEFGTVTAQVRESPSGDLLAEKTAEVMVEPAPPVMGSLSYEHGNCALGTLFGTPSTSGGWLRNGAAYSATTALFVGFPSLSVPTSMVHGNITTLYCVAGAFEASAASRPEGDGIHTVSVTMTMNDGETRWINRVQTCTYRGGTCWSMSRVFTNGYHTAVVGGRDRFDLVGNHRITLGNETITLKTSTSVQEG